MAVDFSQDIKTAERQMNRYVRNGQKIPRDALDHYTNLLTGKAGGSLGSSGSGSTSGGSSSDALEGDLATTFASATDTDTIILIGDTDRNYVLIQNLGDEVIYINFGASAAVNGGLKLGPDASWSSQLAQFAESEIHAIASSNTSALAIYTIGA